MSEFRFKQFTIIQDKTAMKLSTDSVLIGAWANADNPQNILEIGTGTGVVAIMLAQRFKFAKITTVEIDKTAFNEAAENIKNSPWANRITAINADFTNFAQNNTDNYDLIVSNPPFFDNQLLPPNKNKQIAKHTTSLNFENLITNSAKLLSESGKFCVILPYSTHSKFVHLCSKIGLYLSKKNIIYPTEKKSPNRVLLQFTKRILPTKEETLLIRQNGKYSAQYLQLTREFYLFA